MVTTLTESVINWSSPAVLGDSYWGSTGVVGVMVGATTWGALASSDRDRFLGVALDYWAAVPWVEWPVTDSNGTQTAWQPAGMKLLNDALKRCDTRANYLSLSTSQERGCLSAFVALARWVWESDAKPLTPERAEGGRRESLILGASGFTAAVQTGSRSVINHFPLQTQNWILSSGLLSRDARSGNPTGPIDLSGQSGQSLVDRVAALEAEVATLGGVSLQTGNTGLELVSGELSVDPGDGIHLNAQGVSVNPGQAIDVDLNKVNVKILTPGIIGALRVDAANRLRLADDSVGWSQLVDEAVRAANLDDAALETPISRGWWFADPGAHNSTFVSGEVRLFGSSNAQALTSGRLWNTGYPAGVKTIRISSTCQVSSNSYSTKSMATPLAGLRANHKVYIRQPDDQSVVAVFTLSATPTVSSGVYTLVGSMAVQGGTLRDPYHGYGYLEIDLEGINRHKVDSSILQHTSALVRGVDSSPSNYGLIISEPSEDDLKEVTLARLWSDLTTPTIKSVTLTGNMRDASGLTLSNYNTISDGTNSFSVTFTAPVDNPTYWVILNAGMSHIATSAGRWDLRLREKVGSDAEANLVERTYWMFASRTSAMVLNVPAVYQYVWTPTDVDAGDSVVIKAQAKRAQGTPGIEAATFTVIEMA